MNNNMIAQSGRNLCEDPPIFAAIRSRNYKEISKVLNEALSDVGDELSQLKKITELVNEPRKCDGYTPLHVAVMKNDYGITLLLLHCGADPNYIPRFEVGHKQIYFKSPLELFCRLPDRDCGIKILLSENPNYLDLSIVDLPRKFEELKEIFEYIELVKQEAQWIEKMQKQEDKTKENRCEARDDAVEQEVQKMIAENNKGGKTVPVEILVNNIDYKNPVSGNQGDEVEVIGDYDVD